MSDHQEGFLWGGRFQGGPAEAMFQLSVSTQFDWRLAPEDIAGSIAHASALHRAGLLGDADYEQMEAALRGMLEEVHSGELRPAPTDEDVHGALERILTERVGPVLGGRLRAGRSRNDQIATLIRMYLRREIRALGQDVVEVITALCAQS
ncbi:MAG: argininosuccinate lyase, partial [Propionibacterium sp.]|nr:argininosuccinate lyase [Propionibacterium sp.]